MGQPYPQSAPPYDMPTTSQPYPYTETPPAATPPPAPPRKGRQVVWFASGIIAAMVIATLLVGGIVIGQDNGKTSATKTSASPTPTTRTYKIVSSICDFLKWNEVQKLAPNFVEAGTPDDNTYDNSVIVECDSAIYSTGDGSKAEASASVYFYHDPEVAEAKWKGDSRQMCEKREKEGWAKFVPNLGKEACITYFEAGAGGDAATTWLQLLGGNLYLGLEVSHGRSLREKSKEMGEAMIVDAGALLKQLAAQ